MSHSPGYNSKVFLWDTWFESCSHCEGLTRSSLAICKYRGIVTFKAPEYNIGCEMGERFMLNNFEFSVRLMRKRMWVTYTVMQTSLLWLVGLDSLTSIHALLIGWAILPELGPTQGRIYGGCSLHMSPLFCRYRGSPPYFCRNSTSDCMCAPRCHPFSS